MLQSYKGIIFAYLGFGGSMSVFILHGFVKGIPYELEEAAWIDGCSPEGTFFRIIFPLLKPVQVTVLILNGQIKTLLAMIPIIILFLFAQKQIIQGMVDGAIK